MAQPDNQSREELLHHLEDLTGRTFRSRDDVRRYADEMRQQEQELLSRKSRTWKTVKQTALLAALVLAFLQYYLVDTLYEIATLRRIHVFVSVPGETAQHRL